MANLSSVVSIIMASYNAERTIRQAIQSVIDQTYTEWELLVINDCSSDHTSDIISSFADERIRLLNNSTNLGVSTTRKVGLDAARGEWIAILDSDDQWMPEKLEKQMKYANRKGAEFVFTGSSFMDENGELINWQLHVPPTIEYHELLKQNLISNSSVLIKRRLFCAYYSMDDRMHEDFAIWLKITRDGHIAYGIDEPLLIYRLSNSSKSSNKLKAARMNWRTYRYIGLSPLISAYNMCWYTAKGLRKYIHLK